MAASLPVPGPSVTALTAGTLISNGSFESGDFSNWIVSDLSGPFQPLQVRPNGSSPGYGFFNSTATDGTLSATHGFDGTPGTIRMAHEVTVTAAEPFLRFDYRVAWNMQSYSGSTLARTFAVTILPSSGGSPLQSTIFVTATPGSQNLDTGALSGAMDLTAYIGTTIRVSFDAMIPENATGPGFFQLDNVRTAALLNVAALTPGTLVSNGSFETGDFANWIVSDIAEPFEPLQVTPDGRSPGSALFSSQATDGVLSAVHGFDGAGPGLIRLAHELTVTAAEPFLRFDYRLGWDMESHGSTQARTIAVSVLPSGGGTALQRTVIATAASGSKNLDSGPQSGVVDLSAYIGTTIQVSFEATIPEDHTGPGFFQLDNVRTATLLLPLPTAITAAATAVTVDKVTLHGVVNAHGPSTVVTFEYGHHAGYGFTANATPSPVNDNGNSAVSAIVSGLQPGTTYHYRVKASSANGTAYGSDMTFTTLTELEDWRFTYFGITTNTGNAADDVDADADGHDNLFEYVAGLVPNDPASRFTLQVEPVVGEPEQKAIVFSPVLAGRTYVVKSRGSLNDGTWEELSSFTSSDSENERTVIDLGAFGGTQFYRVEITKP